MTSFFDMVNEGEPQGGCQPRHVQHDFNLSRPVFRVTWALFQADLLCISLLLALLAAFDALVASRTKARWWLLHLLANALVVLTALPDFYQTLRDPANALTTIADYSIWPLYFVGSIHAYHLLAFRNLPLGDWVHHLLFGGVICGAGLTFVTGPLMSVLAFFLSGLPGGLDYAMLAAVKHGLMARQTEKVWNARVNVWIRSPGCTLCAFTIYLNMVYSPIPPTFVQLVAALVVAALCMLNGQYYMQVVVGNTHRKVQDYAC